MLGVSVDVGAVGAERRAVARFSRLQIHRGVADLRLRRQVVLTARRILLRPSLCLSAGRLTVVYEQVAVLALAVIGAGRLAVAVTTAAAEATREGDSDEDQADDRRDGDADDREYVSRDPCQHFVSCLLEG